MDNRRKLLVYAFIGIAIVSLLFVYRKAYITGDFEITPIGQQPTD